jgi:hypothetical protein
LAIRLAILFLLLSSALEATTTVTGHVVDLGTNAVISNTYVRFTLRGCGGNQATVPGVGVLAPTQGAVWFKDFPVDGSGNVSGTIYSTRDATGLLGGDISCGGSFLAVWFGMTIWVNGKPGPEIPVHALNAATLNVSSVLPIVSPPVVPAPTGDSIYCRLDGANGVCPGAGTSTAFKVNSVSLLNPATVNFINSAAFNGLTFSFTNTSLGNIQLGASGTLSNAGLANSSLTVNLAAPGTGGGAVSLGGTLSLAMPVCAEGGSHNSGLAPDPGATPGTTRFLREDCTYAVPPGAGTTVTIANGTAALGTSAISSGTCASTVTVTATGAASTDNLMADFNADPTGVTGYVPSSNGILTIIKWASLNAANFKNCNNTASSITPGAITLNWRVVR